MNVKDHPDWRDRVAKHWRDTTGFLLAFGAPCLRIAADEVAKIRKNRVLVDLSGSLADWKPPSSWLMAVILCPDDDITPLLAWIRDHKVDPNRIIFYPHEDTDIFQVLEPWHDAHFTSPRTAFPIRSWQDLHPQFGRDLSVQILGDHASA